MKSKNNESLTRTLPTDTINNKNNDKPKVCLYQRSGSWYSTQASIPYNSSSVISVWNNLTFYSIAFYKLYTHITGKWCSILEVISRTRPKSRDVLQTLLRAQYVSFAVHVNHWRKPHSSRPSSQSPTNPECSVWSVVMWPRESFTRQSSRRCRAVCQWSCDCRAKVWKHQERCGREYNAPESGKPSSKQRLGWDSHQPANGAWTNALYSVSALEFFQIWFFFQNRHLKYHFKLMGIVTQFAGEVRRSRPI